MQQRAEAAARSAAQRVVGVRQQRGARQRGQQAQRERRRHLVAAGADHVAQRLHARLAHRVLVRRFYTCEPHPTDVSINIIKDRTLRSLIY